MNKDENEENKKTRGRGVGEEKKKKRGSRRRGKKIIKK